MFLLDGAKLTPIKVIFVMTLFYLNLVFLIPNKVNIQLSDIVLVGLLLIFLFPFLHCQCQAIVLVGTLMEYFGVLCTG